MKRKRPSHPLQSKTSATPAAPPGNDDTPPSFQEQPIDKWNGGRGLMLWSMVALSGFACLVYQILWMRQLGLLFGNTSHAAALTLAVFFTGLAIGGWFWGRRSPQMANPLRAYGWLELGIAVAGAPVFAAPAVCNHFYPMFYTQDDGVGLGLLAFKILWTLLMVFPPAFLMGGTLPVLGQALIHRKAAFGTTTARIYAINTIGAACGAFATAFVLIWYLGFRLTCGVAMSISILAAVLAFSLSRYVTAITEPSQQGNRSTFSKLNAQPPLSRMQIGALAFLSGFNVLALEVLWTRMFAQVHENSVYSFSSVLIIVLVCLAMGAWLASRLARGTSPPLQSLVILITAGGVALCASPFIFMELTHDLRMLPTESSFPTYIFQLFVTGFAAIGPACLLLGSVFPFLMKSEENFTIHAGKSIGMLSAVNTLGAILGSLVCGFVLLHWLGLWRSIQLVAVSYLMVAILMPAAKTGICRAAKAGALVMLVLAFTVLDSSKLPKTWTTGPMGETATMVEQWEASDSTVSVVKNLQDQFTIKINSNYSLGSTAAYGPQIFQARIPLLAFPKTESVFFLGMGTGITAGEALNRNDFKNVAEVVACELSPSVVKASKKYFAGGVNGPDLTNGLFHDPRARILVEDGRNHLMATRESYEMINADLFLPYRSGTGSLYSREHFQHVLARLKPGGVFVQWLPLYQVSEKEFGVIAHTMISVFPQVSLWRGNFQPGAEMVALIGHRDISPLPTCVLDVEREKQFAVANATYLDMHNLMLPINEQTVLLFYCGNLGLARDLFAKHPLNTDDKPVIEFGTPRSLHRTIKAGKPHFVGARFADLVDKVQSKTPPESDPLLASRDPSSRKLPIAGAAFHRASIASIEGDDEKWRDEWNRFLSHWIEPSSAPIEP